MRAVFPTPEATAMLKPAPASSAAQLQQAIALHNQGHLDAADAIYETVLLQAPRHPDALHLRALVCHAQQRFADAVRFAEAAIGVNPQIANFHNTAGEAWRRQGRLDQAQKYLQQALRLDPRMAMAYLNLSLVHSGQGRHDDALLAVRRALALHPASVDALVQALEICCAQGDQGGAAEFAQRLQPGAGQRVVAQALGRYHNYLARQQRQQQRWDEAARELTQALELYPDFWGNWALQAEACNDAQDFSNAELYCCLAANLAPDNEDARLNIGHFLQEQKRFAEARSHYQGWLDAHPDSDAARFRLASLSLMHGAFEAGWKDYEARWGVRHHTGSIRIALAPDWDGGPCARLLLYAEQGLGDTIQMLRFLPQVAQRSGAAITLLVPQPLLRMARRAAGAAGIEVAAELPAGVAFDAVCALMSLPHVLRAHSAEALGMRAPYITADPERQAFFKEKLAGLKGKKIGIVWQGSANALTSRAERRRPFTLDALAPLAALPELSFVSLQYGVAQAAIGATPLTMLTDDIADFDDLAAAMMALDAVISVDTGPTHLAGALGVPTCTIIPWLADWRWGVDGAASYWYPGMTQVRQSQHAERDDTVAQLMAIFAPERPQAAAAPAALPDAGQRAVAENIFPLVQLNCRDGQISAPLFDPVTTRSLLACGAFPRRDTAALGAYLQSGDTVLDIGAGLGERAIGWARQVGAAGRVLGFEPEPMLQRCLSENVARARLQQIEIRAQAAGRQSGQISAPLRNALFQYAGASAPLAVVALDSLGLSACALLAIDAGGAELDVLEGARALIEQCQPVVCMTAGRSDALPACLAFLRQRGYQAYRLAASALPAEAHRHGERIAGPAAPTVLALPAGKAPPAGAEKL